MFFLLVKPIDHIEAPFLEMRKHASDLFRRILPIVIEGGIVEAACVTETSQDGVVLAKVSCELQKPDTPWILIDEPHADLLTTVG